MTNEKTFDYKGFGRIFVIRPEDVQKVADIIKEIDEFEFRYMPDDLIAVGANHFRDGDLVYVGKFEPDMAKVEAVCAERGIPICWESQTYADHEGITSDIFNPYEDSDN